MKNPISFSIIFSRTKGSRILLQLHHLYKMKHEGMKYISRSLLSSALGRSGISLPQSQETLGKFLPLRSLVRWGLGLVSRVVRDCTAVSSGRSI